MCAEIYWVFRRSAHICTVYRKSLTAESGLEGTRKSARISESIIGMKIGPFVSYIKWLGELGSVGCVFIACSVPFVRLIPRGHFFPKLYASYFLWNLSFILLARVCYTADCNVLTLRRSSCSSTLPLFVQQTKDGPYLNLNLASKRYLYHHTKQPAEIKAPWTYNRQISQHVA